MRKGHALSYIKQETFWLLCGDNKGRNREIVQGMFASNKMQEDGCGNKV